MSALIATVTTAEIALVAATAKTLLQLKAPTNQRLKLLAWGIYFDSTSNSAEPVQVVLERQTTAIGGTPTAITPSKIDDSIGDSVQATAAVYGTSPTEPTSGDLLKRIEVHPQAGYEEQCPFGQEYIVGAGDRIAIKATAPAGVNAVSWMKFEE
ncbi:MAG: hypothetical protein AB1631_23495 [Acidobacteriota bacterium]